MLDPAYFGWVNQAPVPPVPAYDPCYWGCGFPPTQPPTETNPCGSAPLLGGAGDTGNCPSGDNPWA